MRKIYTSIGKIDFNSFNNPMTLDTLVLTADR